MFAGKNLRMTHTHTQKKVSHADLIKKDLILCVKKDAYAAAKHKIILSRPYNELITL